MTPAIHPFTRNLPTTQPPHLRRSALESGTRFSWRQIEMETPLLVGDFLRRAAKLYPNKTAVVD
ncbi:hypothetical protein J0H33_01955, partial [bacterium]|nr:hypothetical protein [bacterium]